MPTGTHEGGNLYIGSDPHETWSHARASPLSNPISDQKDSRERIRPLVRCKHPNSFTRIIKGLKNFVSRVVMASVYYKALCNKRLWNSTTLALPPIRYKIYIQTPRCLEYWNFTPFLSHFLFKNKWKVLEYGISYNTRYNEHMLRLPSNSWMKNVSKCWISKD